MLVGAGNAVSVAVGCAGGKGVSVAAGCEVGSKALVGVGSKVGYGVLVAVGEEVLVAVGLAATPRASAVAVARTLSTKDMVGAANGCSATNPYPPNRQKAVNTQSSAATTRIASTL